MIKLYYISNSILPSQTANSVHVMKMCKAFSQNYKVKLIGKCAVSKETDEIFFHYDVPKDSFELVLFKVWAIPACSLVISLVLFPFYIMLFTKKNTEGNLFQEQTCIICACFFWCQAEIRNTWNSS